MNPSRTQYQGLSYEGASREAERLIEQGWFKNWDRLVILHEIMVRELESRSASVNRFKL